MAPDYKHLLELLVEAIDYSFLLTTGEYDTKLSYPVIDKVNYIKKALKESSEMEELGIVPAKTIYGEKGNLFKIGEKIKLRGYKATRDDTGFRVTLYVDKESNDMVNEAFNDWADKVKVSWERMDDFAISCDNATVILYGAHPLSINRDDGKAELFAQMMVEVLENG